MYQETGSTRYILDVARVIQSAVEYHSLRRTPVEKLLEQRGDYIRKKLTNPSNRYAVMVCARNESQRLPCLMAGLARQVQGVNILVVDNGSTDGTAEIAKNLGASVITEEKKGLINALTGGFRYFAQESVQPSTILLTDSDCLPVPTWSVDMNRVANEVFDHDTGGQIFAPFLFQGSLTKDLIRSVVSITIDARYWLKRKARAKGANGLLFTDNRKTILKVLSRAPKENIITGTDGYVHDQVLACGGKGRFNFSLKSVVITDGCRYKSLLDLLKTFLFPKHREILYREWFRAGTEGVRYSVRDKPSFLSYERN